MLNSVTSLIKGCVAGLILFAFPPLIAGDKVVTGGWVTDNQQIGNPSGVVRAYDALTGEFAWAWDLGKPGYQGLPDEGAEYTRGTPNVWSNMSYDPVLNLIEQPQRRETLIAKRCEVDGKPAYRFDIRIQGEGETVFFDF